LITDQENTDDYIDQLHGLIPSVVEELKKGGPISSLH